MSLPPISVEKMNRAVVAYLDGRRLKGYLFNFSALKESFRLFSDGPGGQQSGTDVLMKDLKAIFFVKDFAGNPEYTNSSSVNAPKHGRKVVVTFRDGEEITGATEAYNPQKLGFFMFPHDENGNNLRVFVVNKNVRQVKLS
ncbi:MAG TPA: hypothetical protein VFI38_08805 [Candidatus Acidoferrum sp.]|nr:hypothetical protein [Candidatus Acidoferrum sp.]